ATPDRPGASMSEAVRIADQPRRAFEGNAWHGDSLFEMLNGVSSGQAVAHPIPNAHSIWELVLHITAWDKAVLRRLGGEVVELESADNFPPRNSSGEAAWHRAIEAAKSAHNKLAAAVDGFPDARLSERVPGKDEPWHDFYYMLHGVVQHELYHAGQIALLKKAVKS